MWYRDMRREGAKAVRDHLGCSAKIARDVVERAIAAHTRGEQGNPFLDGFEHRDEYSDVREIEVLISRDVPAGIDRSELARLYYDAWLTGIEKKDRLVVRLDSTACDACCASCGRSLPNGVAKCVDVPGACGDGDVAHNVLATASGPFADRWAECNTTIDGSTWERVSNTEVYSILPARKGLADELRADGYKLDLTNYEEEP